MPIRFGALDRNAAQEACATLKAKLEELGFSISRDYFYRSSRGHGLVMRVNEWGELIILVDVNSHCRISVPAPNGRRYVSGYSVMPTINDFLTRWARPKSRELADRRREQQQRDRQGELMKGTLERVFSRSGLVFNERRSTMYPGNRRFVCREVEFQGLSLSLEGTIDQAVPTFTSVNIRGGVTSVNTQKLVRALSLLTGQRPCPV